MKRLAIVALLAAFTLPVGASGLETQAPGTHGYRPLRAAQVAAAWPLRYVPNSALVVPSLYQAVCAGVTNGSACSGVTGILPGANGGTNNGFMDFTGPATTLKTFTLPNASATILTSNAAVTVAQGGTGLTAGTSGGVPCYTASGTIASSGALTANALVKGGGAGVCPTASLASDNGTLFSYTGSGGINVGGSASATPATGALAGQNGSGTNIAGGAFYITSGRSTGSAVPSLNVLQSTALGGTSGTTLQTPQDRFVVGASKTGLANNTATTFLQLTAASNSSNAVTVEANVEATDATDYQLITAPVQFSCTNKAGTMTANVNPAVAIVVGTTGAGIATGGTQAVTFSTSTAAGVCNLRVTSNSGVITPTTIRITYNYHVLGQQAVTPQ